LFDLSGKPGNVKNLKESGKCMLRNWPNLSKVSGRKIARETLSC